MHLNIPPSSSKKRKRSTGDGPESDSEERTSSIVRRSIALLTAIPDLPTASFSPLLDTLTEAYHSALIAEEAAAQKPAPAQREEDWNWQLSPEQIAGLVEEERTIWKAFLVGRDLIRGTVSRSLAFAKVMHKLKVLQNIKLHPLNWTMPVVDLRQWEAHIPGPAGTPWEGGVYSLTIKFKPGSPDLLPKFRFLVPLFHPNVYPSGNWAYIALDHDIIKGRANRATAWKCTFEEDPTRLMKLLQNIQRGLHEHDMNHPSQSDAYTMAKNDPKEYDAKIRAEAEDWKPDPQTGLAGRRIHRH